jgi:hypothetical protein
LASGTVLRGCYAGATLRLGSRGIEFGVILHNSVEHNHELAKETTEYSDLILVWCSETVNINNIIEDDALNGYTFCDIGTLNLLSKGFNFSSFTSSFSLLLALQFVCNSLSFCFFGSFFGSLTFIRVVFDGFLVDRSLFVKELSECVAGVAIGFL